MQKEKKLTIKDLRETRRQALDMFHIDFDLERDSFEGRMLELAVLHYTSGTADTGPLMKHNWQSHVVMLILRDWLLNRLEFPTLQWSKTDYPLPTRRVEAKLTQLE